MKLSSTMSPPRECDCGVLSQRCVHVDGKALRLLRLADSYWGDHFIITQSWAPFVSYSSRSESDAIDAFYAAEEELLRGER